MKKIYLALICLFIVNSFIYSQNKAYLIKTDTKQVVSEDFEIWPPTNWSLYNLGIAPQRWMQSWDGTSHGGSYSAMHSIHNDHCDNWMVSPQISVESGYQLIFWEYLTDIYGGYYEYSGVLISTGSGDPNDAEFVEIYETNAPLETWQETTLDLDSYVGQDIYIAFQLTGTWHAWYIDDFFVGTPTYTDAGLDTLLNPVGLSQTTGIEDIIVTLTNYGTEVIDDANIEWSVNGVPQSAFIGTGLNLQAGNSTDLTIGQYNFAVTGTYFLDINLDLTGDSDPTNNTLEEIYMISEPTDGSIVNINPEGFLPEYGFKNVKLTMENVGTNPITEVSVQWSVNGTSQTDYNISGINIPPGEFTELNIGQYNFNTALFDIEVSIIPLGDLSIENNTKQVYGSIGILWESFEGDIPPEGWTNNFGFKDNFENIIPHGEYYYYAEAAVNIFGTITDTLYTPLLDIESGDQMSFWVNRTTAFAADHELIWKNGSTGEINSLMTINTEPLVWREVIADLTPAAGMNYIGWVTSSSTYGWSKIDLVSSDASLFLYTNDLAVSDFQIDETTKINDVSSFYCNVKNTGISDISDGAYSVKLMQEPGIMLSSVTGTTIASLEEILYTLNYTFTEINQYSLYFEIEYANDDYPDNNISDLREIYTIPNTVDYFNIGEFEFYDANTPFDGSGSDMSQGEDDISQCMYYTDEINTAGLIYGIQYYYKNIGGNIDQTLPLKVWIAESVDDDLSNGYIPNEELQLVFDQSITIRDGENSLYIPFNEPYLYTNLNNIVIQCYQYDPEWPPSALRFQTEFIDDGTIRSISNLNVYELDPLNPPFYTNELNQFPVTTFVIDPIIDLCSISGTVYDENNDPFEGAEIMVEGSLASVYTNAAGNYTLPELPYETYNIIASFYGYDDNVQNVDANQANLTVDFYMDLRPQVLISGNVVGSNDPLTPLEGVNVTLEGYDNLNTVSNVTGDFEFVDVYGNAEYKLSLSKYGYLDYTETISTAGDDIDIGTITLQEEFISAYNVVASGEESSEAEITWSAPAGSSKEQYQNDFGNPSYSFTNEPFENVWLGNIFNNNSNITLTSVEIYWDIYDMSSTEYITIDIFDDSQELIATSEAFNTYEDSLMTIDLPNIPVSADFYIMVHWQDNADNTDAITIDYSDGIPNTACIKYPGEPITLMTDYIPESWDGSFLLRANYLTDAGKNSLKEVLSYNVYRGFADDIGNIESWDQINSNAITETDFLDVNWFEMSFGQEYRYAVEAIYTEGNAESSFSNTLLRGEVGIDNIANDIKVFPIPANDVLYITNIENCTIEIYNEFGALIKAEKSDSEIYSVNMSDLRSGIYFVKILKDNNFFTYKVNLIHR